MPKDQVFDVIDPLGDDNKYFHAVRDMLMEKVVRERNLKLKAKNIKDLDGKVYNYICNAEGFNLVRAATYTYRETDRQYGFQSRVPNAIELCIRNTEYIKSKEIIGEVKKDGES